MTRLHKIVRTLKKYPRLYSTLVLPFYFLRFVLTSMREGSLWFLRYPPGHFSSTLPSQREIDQRRHELFARGTAGVDGTDLNTVRQLELLNAFSTIGGGLAFNREAQPGRRYFYNNEFFRLSDAIILTCVLEHLQTRNVIEVGSGFSSALMLDLQESAPRRSLTLIEPYPTTLKHLMWQSDLRRCRIIEQKVQDVPPEEFDRLQAGDVLFIDSSHVVKIGSDLSTLLFSVLPRLKAGVAVHFHDISWPFEYREAKLREGRSWNEAYFVRSFLQFNDSYEILYFSSYIEQVHRQHLNRCLPNYTEYTGASLWLRRRK